jgi:hypothetical protein
MRFLVQVRVFETISGKEQDRAGRDILGPQIQRVLEGSKVREAGFLADQRGFFLMDIDEPEEIYETLGPEIYGQCHVKVSPVVAPEKVGSGLRRVVASGGVTDDGVYLGAQQ